MGQASAAGRKLRLSREMVDRCRRFDTRQASSSCQMFPSKCQPLSFFITGRGIVRTSMWIENRGRPENTSHHSQSQIGPESAVKQHQNRYRIGR
jgi:hypothetical protein